MKRKDRMLTRMTAVFGPSITFLFAVTIAASVVAGGSSLGPSNFDSLVNTALAQVAVLSQPVMNAVQCTADGTSATLTWGSVSGAEVYAVRVDDLSNNTSSCADGWYCNNVQDYINDANTNRTITRTVTPGRSYSWWVHAKYANTWNGTSGFTKLNFSCPPPAAQTLSQPVMNAVQCTADGTSATLTWGSVSGAEVYAVRIDDTSNNSSSCLDGWYCNATQDYLTDSQSTRTLTRTVTPGRSYSWWIHAKKANTWDLLSGSTKVNFSCSAQTPPTPQGLTQPTMNPVQCSAGGTSATLSWSAVSGASYSVRYKGTGLPPCPSGWYNGASSECDIEDTSLTSLPISIAPGKTYQWWVHAKYPGTWTGASSYTQVSFSCPVSGPSCTPASPSTQTQTLACPTGQTGSITQTRNSSCAVGATSPTWSAWTTTSSTCSMPSGGVSVGLPALWDIGSWLTVATTISTVSGVTTITEDRTTGTHGVQQYLNVPSSPRWQLSFDMSPVGARVARVYLFNSQDQSVYAATMCYPTGTGTVSKWGSASASVEASIAQLSGGWYRCSLRGSLSSSSVNPSQLYMVIYIEQNTLSSYLGNGSSGLKLRNVALTGEFSGGTAAKATADSNLVTSLFAQREGFGANTTGGLGGEIYTVTTLADNNLPGSLRFAAEDASKPYWIVFSPGLSGTITLNSSIYVGANKTIDGRGSSITVANHGFNVPNANVIINNIAVRNINNVNEDNISIYGVSAKNIWVHRVSLSGQNSDGLLDITDGATDITVDWSRFTDHDKVMIINSYATSPDPNNPNGEILNGHEYDNQVRDSNVRLTLHHNAFVGTLQRHPRSVFAKIHMYNNVLQNWGYYGVGSSFLTQTLAEGNIFNSSGQYANQALVTRIGIDPVPGYIKAVNNLFLSGASGASSGAINVFAPSYTYRCEKASTALQTMVLQQAGVEGSDAASSVSFGGGCPAL